MKNICFFSHGHNGDIAHTKTFLFDIVNQLDIPCFYYHEKNKRLTQDLPLVTLMEISLPEEIDPFIHKFIETEDTLYINIWLAPWRIDGSPLFYNINLSSFYNMFTYICEHINSLFGTNVKLKSVDSYFPIIDFNYVEKEKINSYVERSSNKKILFCNGPTLSGQSYYNGDMSGVIKDLSIKYKNIDFIATQKFDIDNLHTFSGPIKKNIYFTDDIIQIRNCDLNEIGYLSTFCNVIVGRTSGPFCFSTIMENYKNPQKIFYMMGQDRKKFCFHGDVKIDAKFIFKNDINEEMIYNTIDFIIKENLE
jgi:hypothetical protein